ncbi:glycoside hydrolase family 75 protein [Streptomyces sp. NPDC048720]|uniref:glycoside hydrolase family 75 protein n=1 Tax=Streptomyces sp. NPDC048720 TaxID=3365588 RepID=UPI003721CBAA
MRVQTLTLVVAGAALLAPTTPPAAAVPTGERPPAARDKGAATAARGEGAATAVRGEGAVTAARGGGAVTAAHGEGAVTAADLLDRVRSCDRVSRGGYRTDHVSSAKVSVCGTRGAVFWKADLDIDCDGRPTARCNRRTDPLFAAATAYQQSDGRHLSAASLPYIVLPGPSRIWDHRDYGIRGGSVAAVVYRDRVQYAVVGDAGPRDIIGEASYATARGLGIHPDPIRGGAASGVTYIVFKDSRITPIESHRAAVQAGERLARHFVDHH